MNEDQYIKTGMTTSLFRMLEQSHASEEAVLEIIDAVDFYTEEYKRLKAKFGWMTAIGSYQMEIDKSVNAMPAEDKAKLSCGRGCAHCCHINVDITDDEAKLLIMYARTLNYKIDMETLEAQKGLDETTRMLMPDHRRCVFLNEKNECAVYEHRPLACRKQLVFSAPDLCNAVKYPKGITEQYMVLNAELFASGTINATETGSMADMLLKEINQSSPKPNQK